jgi:outer membrane PBP1 activator LpoA protein
MVKVKIVGIQMTVLLMRLFRPLRMNLLLAVCLTSIALSSIPVSAFALPAQIAVLLPQSGRMAKAAETIRDGLLAAYYQDSRASADSPVLRFYDSDAGDILTLVKQAEKDGANFIIGPLDRERVERVLKNATPITLPMLALNSVEGGADNFFQFALSPEDETERLVAWMEQRNIQQPLIITSTEDAGQRQQKLFQTFWRKQHSNSVPVVTLDATRKGGIVAATRDLIKQQGSHDAFFLASPSLARQVLPSLIYYHSRLPLYSLSSAWNPAADVSEQQDLNGLQFCDQPWMVESLRPEQQSLYNIFARPGSNYDRLYAFGADAWTLVTKWAAVQDGEALPLRSGLVQTGHSGHLHRTLNCAEVSNGTATVLWSPENRRTPAGSGR